MSMLNIVSAVSCGFAIICFVLYVYQIITRPKQTPAQIEEDRADAVRQQGAVADWGKAIEAFAKLTDSLEKAGPLLASLVGAIFFLSLAALTAGIELALRSTGATTSVNSSEHAAGELALENKLVVRIDSLETKVDRLINSEIPKLIAQMELQHATLNTKLENLTQLINSTSVNTILKNLWSTDGGHSAAGPIMISIGNPTSTPGGNHPVQSCNTNATCCCETTPFSVNAARRSNSRSRQVVTRCH
jgi:hypothetical protein